ncbi:MAG: FtsX-like permease family protein [Nitrospinota bacterium]|nr:FtsX-like permease family protein [Nitrospinota bacterium]
MIRWILKGILRDKTRSLFPFLVVSVGVALVIALMGFMEGILMGMLDVTANLDTGHLRLVNKSFYEEEYLLPMDRALAAQRETLSWLKKNSDPKIQWSPRIRWGAIMDVPDEKGETVSQTPITGMALDLFSPDTPELDRLKLAESLTQGRLPRQKKEMLIGYQLAETLDVKLGNPVTLIGQSFDGGLVTDNYIMVGFVRFGVFLMDKKMAVMDIADAQETFYVEDMVTDWLGFLPASVPIEDYEKHQTILLDSLQRWNPPASWANDDEPIIKTIFDQRNLRELTQKFFLIRNIIVAVFVFLMILVLWNAGLLNGIHRYGEMGLRLSLGETHKQLILTLVIEALIIGLVGSLAGSVFGGGVVYYLQEVGIDLGDNLAQTGVMQNDIVRGKLSVHGFLQGIIPGVTASVLGTFIAALTIFKRSEADLFRELEVG